MSANAGAIQDDPLSGGARHASSPQQPSTGGGFVYEDPANDDEINAEFEMFEQWHLSQTAAGSAAAAAAPPPPSSPKYQPAAKRQPAAPPGGAPFTPDTSSRLQAPPGLTPRKREVAQPAEGACQKKKAPPGEASCAMDTEPIVGGTVELAAASQSSRLAAAGTRVGGSALQEGRALATAFIDLAGGGAGGGIGAGSGVKRDLGFSGESPHKNLQAISPHNHATHLARPTSPDMNPRPPQHAILYERHPHIAPLGSPTLPPCENIPSQVSQGGQPSAGSAVPGLEAGEVEQLSPEQRTALDAALAGRNLFVTGSAGVGKSFLVDLVVRALRARHKRVVITASTGSGLRASSSSYPNSGTPSIKSAHQRLFRDALAGTLIQPGIAAVNVRGTTLHSFAGVGFAMEPALELANQVARDRRKVAKWKEADVLVIDEISMISDDLFDKVEYVGRRCRSWLKTAPTAVHPEPFGGLQVIAVGDFFQLPPVSKPHQGGDRQGFCFESRGWASCRFLAVVLTRVFRQQDAEFVGLLNALRRGDVTVEAVAMLSRSMRPLPVDDGILPTTLFPHRASVAEKNKAHFDELPGETVTFDCQDGGNLNYKSWLDDVQAPPRLELKIGAQVMLVTNLDFEAGLVNGSRGVVTGYVSTAEFRRRDGAALGFDTGGGPGASAGAGRGGPAPRMQRWLQGHPQLPEVRFADGRKRVIPPNVWEHAVLGGRDKVYRVQMPLMHAWALTIHKCQGMSLDRVRMSLAQVFADGQAYVALSRARSLAGIQLDNFDSRRIRANERVVRFYEGLRSLEELPAVANGPALGLYGWPKRIDECLLDAVSACLHAALEHLQVSEAGGAERVFEAFQGMCRQAMQEGADAHFNKVHR